MQALAFGFCFKIFFIPVNSPLCSSASKPRIKFPLNFALLDNSFAKKQKIAIAILESAIPRPYILLFLIVAFKGGYFHFNKSPVGTVSKQDSSQIVFPEGFLLILQKTEGCFLFPIILGEKPNWESFLKTKSAILFSESIPFCEEISTNCLVKLIMSEYNFCILKFF